MLRFEDGCYGSLKGIALIAKVLAGRCRMHYTRVAAGKGEIPDDLTPKTLLEPPEYVMDAMIGSVTNPVDGECQVSVQLNSANVKEGFYCKWLILYAEDPDEGEVPFTALCLEGEPEWIRPSSSIVGKLAHFDIIAAVGDVDTVSAAIDPDALVTRKDWDELASQLATTRRDLTIPAAGWTGGGTGKYPYHLDVPVDGATARMIPELTITEEGEAAAIACGLAPRVETLDGAVRLSAVSAPSEPIPASLTLRGDASGLLLSGGGEGGMTELPLATAERAGAVKPGSGLNIAPDGTLSVDAASEAEIDEMLAEVITPDNK